MTTLTSTYRFGTNTYDLRSRTFLMGILNVTPDSFSDGGRFLGRDAAVAHALKMVEEGADFIDVGGESTRPGADPVGADAELDRVLPVIRALASRTSVPISIDTVKPEVADAALRAGAVIVNDISGLRAEPGLAAVAASHSASMVLMHMQGTPRTMQQAPVYEDVTAEIGAFLRESVSRARAAGVEQVIVDPGIGFGKLLAHNLEIFRNLRSLEALECPVLIGPSRKSFLGAITGRGPDDRTYGTAAAVAVSILNGANIVRVHDVGAMKQVAQVADAIVHASPQGKANGSL